VPKTVMSTITALIFVTSAPISFRFSWPAAHYDRGAAAEAVALKLPEPLIQAAFHLETRLYNVLKLGPLWDRGGLTLGERLGGHDG
jgi:hypothetical protein